MKSLLLLSLLLAPPESTPETPAARSFQARFPTAEEFHASYKEIMTKSTRREVPDPLEVTPTLLELFVTLDHVEGMSGPDRRRMHSRLEIRLVEMRQRMLDMQKSQARKSPASNQGGGAVAARAAELIALIENTVAPESWQSAGGQGTISYFSLIPALVIRQSYEAHGEISGALDQLRD